MGAGLLLCLMQTGEYRWGGVFSLEQVNYGSLMASLEVRRKCFFFFVLVTIWASPTTPGISVT